ncbi:MAG: hypothetical protein ABI863_10500 [Ginsengibacter sp.]
MAKKLAFINLIKYGILPAISYCIPVLFFIREDTYSDTWLLYLGNGLFLACMFILGVVYNRKKNINGSVSYNGWVITVISVVLACILILVLLVLFAPGVYHISSTSEIFQQAPAAISKKGSGALLFMLFANAIIGNFCAGTFATLIAKGSSARDPA